TLRAFPDAELARKRKPCSVRPQDERAAPLESSEFTVLNFATGKEEVQRVVFTADDMISSQNDDQNSNVASQDTFTVNSGTNEMFLWSRILYVISGKVKVTIDSSSFEVDERLQYLVPRGNQFSLTNTGVSEAKIHLVYGREVLQSGVQVLKKGAETPNKSSGPTALILFVISGKVRVTLHSKAFEVDDGAQVLIPRGNQYSLANTGKSEAKFHFVCSKEVEAAKQNIFPADEFCHLYQFHEYITPTH
ncbi:hypothetical protein HDU98_001786, partial [Podochytrium sp. JEL0797]